MIILQTASPKFIGERERANLVVQLARFFYIYNIGIYPALMYAVMFYVILNNRKRLGDCVTFSYLSGRAAHTVMFLNMRYMPAMHHAVKCQGARVQSTSSCRLPVLSDLFVVWSGVMRLSSVGSLPLAKNALHSPTSIAT